MRHQPRILVLVVCLGTGVACAQVSIETVTVGHPGNAGELSGAGAGGFGPDRICGAVSYVYNIGKFEVTAAQYTVFLSAVAADDTYGLYQTAMWNDSFGCGIERHGAPGTYTYSVAGDSADRPVNYVSWGDAARYANWLHNGQPGLDVPVPQDEHSTEKGSYDLDGASSDAALTAVVREPSATWVIPTEDEWYKAAYHYNDGATAAYHTYPMCSNAAPNNDLTEPDPGNSANFFIEPDDYTVGDPHWRTEVGRHENSRSCYGTFDQGGNVWEWNEEVFFDLNRGTRGGSYWHFDIYLRADTRLLSGLPTSDSDYVGFRVVEIPASATADLDGDGDVDLRDHALFGNCMSGQDIYEPPAGCLPLLFHRADIDADDDVDLADHAQMIERFAFP